MSRIVRGELKPKGMCGHRDFRVSDAHTSTQMLAVLVALPLVTVSQFFFTLQTFALAGLLRANFFAESEDQKARVCIYSSGACHAYIHPHAGCAMFGTSANGLLVFITLRT